MTLQRVPKLVVAKSKRCGGRPLIEAVARECSLEQRALIFGNGCAEISGFCARWLLRCHVHGLAFGANVLRLDHNRAMADLWVTEAEIDLTLELRGREHVNQVIASLRAEGYEVHPG